MIRLTDATVLAYTKLRVHKIRTAIAVTVAGLLFGLMAAVIIVVQGVFTSVDHFSDEGLNNRTVLNVTRSGGILGFNEYDSRFDAAFISEVEAAHKAMIEKKKVAAKKFNISYTPEIEDPSLIGIDADTKKTAVKESELNNSVVQEVANKRRQAAYKPFDAEAYLKQYSSAKIIQNFKPIQPNNGALVYMKDKKESLKVDRNQGMYGEPDSPTLTVLDGSLSSPFVSNKKFDPTKGEIPVIIPYNKAEKLLGYEALSASASMQDKYNRLQEVRNRVGEITASFCYRNNASQALISKASAQKDEIEKGASDKQYVKPSVILALPTENSCGAVTVTSDKRTVQEKQYDANFELYQKEIGTYIGEPVQHLVTVRGVGISSELETTGQWSVSEMTRSLFASWLGYGTWTVPENLLAEIPAENRPDSIFGKEANMPAKNMIYYTYDSYLVEFGDKAQARQLLSASGMFGANTTQSDVFATPYGSGVLFVDELRKIFVDILMWMFAIVGLIAVIILASIIGRTVSEGRRESSIFRAIGASRIDIASVYGMYVLLLALRVVFFTAIMGIAIGLVVEVLFWQDATLGARLAYVASDTSKEFHLFSLSSPYLLWIIGIIFASSIVASIIPILLGARRNPIKDMRNE